MKFYYILLLSLISLSAFPQTFNWLKTAGDIKSDFGDHVATDSHGNVFVTGHAQGTCNFGAQTIASASQFNFVAKYDSNGNNLWAKETDICAFMQVDPSGSLIMLVNGSADNIVRFDSAGNPVYTFSLPVQGGANFTGLDIDRAGNYIVSGNYPLYNYLSFFGKFKEHGSVNGTDSALWNINMYPSNQGTASIVNAVATPDNGLMVMGQFGNTYTAKDIYGDSIVLNATQGILGTDVMWLKYDSVGFLSWAKHYNNATTYASVIYDSTSNSYYSQQLNWNTFRAYGQRWDSIGGLIWNTQLTDDASGLQMFVFTLPKLKINNGYLYFIGGNDDFTNTSLGTNTVGAFVLKRFTLNGALVDSGMPPLNSLIFLGDACFSGNSIVLAGGYDGNVTWGNETILNSDSFDNIFVGKIGIDSLFQSPAVTPNGISSESISSYLSVFPNPSNDKIQVLFTDLSDGKIELSLSDMLGNVVYASPAFSISGTSSKTIEVNDLSDGVYVLNVLMNGKRSAQKVVVSH